MKKKIVILGGGESGVGAAVLAKKKGFDVFLSDLSAIKPRYKAMLNEHKIEWEEKTHEKAMELTSPLTPLQKRGEHKVGDAKAPSPLERAGGEVEVIKSPGIPDKAPIVKKLKEQGTPVISEIEFAGRYTNAKMICITGTNGKTTATMLTYHILKNAGLNVGLAGNVGNSLALQVAENNYDYYVVELSSYQLDNMYEFKANIAILLNITPDHLDRYEYDMKKYIASKFRITQNQEKEDVFIYWNSDPNIKEDFETRAIKSTLYPFDLNKTEGAKAYVEKNDLIINANNNNFVMPINKLALEGTHNTYNSMAAGIAACVMNIKKDVIRESLSNFQGVEHRLEYVASVRGIRFINDSKATNVNSCWYAILSVKTPIVLILGGTDKGNDYSEIEKLISKRVHTIVCLGADNSELLKLFSGKVRNIFDTNSMEEAVNIAYKSANKGDTVLLSPCCASFDLFESYEDRGNQFKVCVRNL